MNRMGEIDVFIVAGLTFLFTYALWGIDISLGAIGTGSMLININGYMQPYDLYHICVHILVLTWFFTLGYFMIRFHYVRWKSEQNNAD